MEVKWQQNNYRFGHVRTLMMQDSMANSRERERSSHSRAMSSTHPAAACLCKRAAILESRPHRAVGIIEWSIAN